MADLSKQVWKYQEGVLYLAYRDILGSSRVHWGQVIDDLNVDTDILIGDPPEEVDSVVMITHNTGDDNALKKFWRNANELFEVNREWPNACSVNVFYRSGTANVTSLVMDEMYDQILVLDEDPKIKPLVDVDKQVTESKLLGVTDRAAIATELEECIHSSHELKIAFEALRKRLKTVISSGSRCGIDLARLAKDQKSIRLPDSVIQTDYRRTCAKIALLSKEQFKELILRTKSPSKKFDPISKSLGAIELTGLRGYAASSLVADAVQDVGADALEEMRATSQAIRVLPRLKNQLAAVELLQSVGNWMSQHYAKITSASGLENLLRQSNADPLSIYDIKTECEVDWNLLFDAILGIMKVRRGWPHGYGFSKLANDCGATGSLARQDRLKYSYFLDRRRDLTPGELQKVSEVLADLIKTEVPQNELKGLLATLEENRASQILVRLVGGQEFQPLYWLLERECRQAKVPFRFVRAQESFISDLHERKPGTTPACIINNRHLVHCRSAFDGVTDKRKELCARGRSLRFRLQKGKFVEQFASLRLVVDGFWTEEDMKLLANAGWTHIYYYSELDRLLAEL